MLRLEPAVGVLANFCELRSKAEDDLDAPVRKNSFGGIVAPIGFTFQRPETFDKGRQRRSCLDFLIPHLPSAIDVGSALFLVPLDGVNVLGVCRKYLFAKPIST